MSAIDSTSNQIDDKDLVARLKAGDRSACAVCIDAHSDQLYRVALRIVGDPAEAEDVVQETFVNAFKSLDGFDGRSSLGTWLYRIAHNAALMHLRKTKRIVPLDEDRGDDSVPFPRNVVAWDGTPEVLYSRNEAARILDQAIATLPPTLREVFVLRDMEEFSIAETQQQLGLSEAAVKVRLHRARLALREKLSDYFGEHVPSETRTITCEQLLKYLSAYIDHELDEPLKREASEHIATCRHCHVLLDTTQKTISLYRTHARSQPERTIPIDRRERLYKQIQAAFERRASGKL